VYQHRWRYVNRSGHRKVSKEEREHKRLRRGEAYDRMHQNMPYVLLTPKVIPANFAPCSPYRNDLVDSTVDHEADLPLELADEERQELAEMLKSYALAQKKKFLHVAWVGDRKRFLEHFRNLVVAEVTALEKGESHTLALADRQIFLLSIVRSMAFEHQVLDLDNQGSDLFRLAVAKLDMVFQGRR